MTPIEADLLTFRNLPGNVQSVGAIWKRASGTLKFSETPRAFLLSARLREALRGFVGSQHMVATRWGYSLIYQGMMSTVTRG